MKIFILAIFLLSELYSFSQTVCPIIPTPTFYKRSTGTLIPGKTITIKTPDIAKKSFAKRIHQVLAEGMYTLGCACRTFMDEHEILYRHEWK